MTVRTEGGDSGAGPPLCILSWSTSRLSENGANPLAAVLRDESGAATGREFHRLYEMELDVTIRADDEGDRDTWLSDVADAFTPYEYDSSLFHEDTTEWMVGNAQPRSNPVVEPDWYEGGLVIRFRYVSRVQRAADALTTIDRTVDVE